MIITREIRLVIKKELYLKL